MEINWPPLTMADAWAWPAAGAPPPMKVMLAELYPLPGAVTKVLVAEGDAVAEGDPLVVLEAMKMEHTLRAAGAGTVSRVVIEPGQQVDVGDLLVELEPTGGPA